MPRMSKKRKEEWAFFLNDRGRIAYAPLRGVPGHSRRRMAV